MKYILCVLCTCILIISCSAEPIEPSDKQKEFANLLLEKPGIIDSEWYNTISLTITVDLDKMGPNPKLNAKQLADEIAALGYQYTGKGLCVSIYYPYKNNLASTCVK